MPDDARMMTAVRVECSFMSVLAGFGWEVHGGSQPRGGRVQRVSILEAPNSTWRRGITSGDRAVLDVSPPIEDLAICDCGSIADLANEGSTIYCRSREAMSR